MQELPNIPTYQITKQNVLFIVLDEDPIIHTAETSFCSDLNGCPRHDDVDLVREHITRPLDLGMITNAEAIRLYFGTQLSSSPDELTDDEPSIVDRRNVWYGYEQEMA